MSNAVAGQDQLALDEHGEFAGPAPALWNPVATFAWSVLFSWVFGTVLISKNWTALGRPDRAKRSLFWIVPVVPFIAVAVTLSFAGVEADFLMQGLGIGILTLWYAFDVQPQVQHIRENYGADYPRRGWAKPLSVAASLIVLFVLAAA